MKNSKIRRALLLAACAVLLVVMSVGATLAYLKDDDSLLNTFTVGNVQIKLHETEVNEYGEEPNGITETGNEYKLLPNHLYTKDPTVTVLANSEDSYVRAFVTVTKKAELDTIFAAHAGEEGNEWELGTIVARGSEWEYVGVNRDDADKIVYELRYIGTEEKGDIVKLASTDTVLQAMFSSIKIPSTITNEELANIEGMEISILAQAIQADGFDDAAAAWDAWQ